MIVFQINIVDITPIDQLIFELSRPIISYNKNKKDKRSDKQPRDIPVSLINTENGKFNKIAS
jgi:hypothetical protein